MNIEQFVHNTQTALYSHNILYISGYTKGVELKKAKKKFESVIIILHVH